MSDAPFGYPNCLYDLFMNYDEPYIMEVKYEKKNLLHWIIMNHLSVEANNLVSRPDMLNFFQNCRVLTTFSSMIF